MFSLAEDVWLTGITFPINEDVPMKTSLADDTKLIIGDIHYLNKK